MSATKPGVGGGRRTSGSEGEGRTRTLSDGFEEPEEPFVDDDLVTSQDQDEALEVMDGERNFLERDNFEEELGSPAEDPLAEDFTDIAKHEIVDVAGDDKAGRPIVVVYAYRLPSNKTFNHQKFLRYLMKTLDKFVDQDYTIVYFHYGLKSENKPPIKWLVQAYRVLDRRYKKNLKALYLVHPTKFIRFLWTVFKPFISVKFERKLHYVNYLRELKGLVHTEQLALPKVILENDRLLEQSRKDKGWSRQPSMQKIVLPTQQFGVQLFYIMENNPESRLPPVVEDLIGYLRREGLDTEGLFRRSANLNDVRMAQDRINKGEKIDFTEGDKVHLAAVLLKAFLRELAEPLIPFQLYSLIMETQQLPTDERVNSGRRLLQQLPQENYRLLQAVISFLTEVVKHSDKNRMNANNLALVFGPNLAWPKDEQVTLAQLQHLNGFCYLLLTFYNDIFKN